MENFVIVWTIDGETMSIPHPTQDQALTITRKTLDFLLQVDRQTKQSYATAEAAEKAGMVIKKGHPIVRVSVYDSVETANKIIELPAGSPPTS